MKLPRDQSSRRPPTSIFTALTMALVLVAIAALLRQPLARVACERGLQAQSDWRLPTARRYLELALRLDAELQLARLELARLQLLTGESTAARRHLATMLESTHDQPSLRGRALVVAARDHHESDKPSIALEHFTEALQLAGDLDDRWLEATALIGSARVLYSSTSSQLDEAFKQLRRAHELARELDDPGLIAEAASALGIYTWWYRRERERSWEELFMPALELYRQVDDQRGVAIILALIGSIHTTRNELDKAARHLEESRRILKRIGAVPYLGQIHLYLGALHVGLESYPLARNHYQTGLDLYRRAGSLRGQRNAQGMLADLYMRQGDFEQAVELLDRLIARDHVPPIAVRDYLFDRGNSLLHLGRPADAATSYRRALDIAGRVGVSDASFQARLLTAQAHAYLRAGDRQAAGAALDRAAAIPITAKGWGATVFQLLARADLLDGEGRKPEALAHLLEAAEIESRSYGSARSHFFQTQYQQVFERLFSLLFDGTLAQDDAEALVFRLLEQMRYRSFRSIMVRLADPPTDRRVPGPEEIALVRRIEQLGRRLDVRSLGQRREQLARAYEQYEDLVMRSELAGSRYLQVVDARPVELQELQRALAADTALVEYVLTGDKAFALIVTRDQLDSVVLPAEPSQLEAKVKLFRHLLFGDRQRSASDSTLATRPTSDAGSWRPLSHELWQLLIAPLETTGTLADVERLVLVPMGTLHELPFAALSSPESRFLVERFDLSLTPSATLWTRKRRAATSGTTIAFGLRQRHSDDLPPLPFAEWEATEVAAVLDGKARLGTEASESAFKALASTARQLHVAAHGIGEPRVPLHTHLRLASGGGDDGNLTVREILDLGLEAELVSLSACETGLSPATPGGLEVDRIGFVEAFLHAGASHVLASLLPVNDRAAAEFMIAFYRNLRTSPPGDALAKTQQQMLAGSSEAAPDTDREDFSHPRFWSSFVLIGSASSLSPAVFNDLGVIRLRE